MAKVGKFTKLKSAMKRLPSFTKLSRRNSYIAPSSTAADNSGCHHHHNSHNNAKEVQVHAVYVGKSRRRYFLKSDIVCHPLFLELVERSGGLMMMEKLKLLVKLCCLSICCGCLKVVRLSLDPCKNSLSTILVDDDEIKHKL